MKADGKAYSAQPPTTATRPNWPDPMSAFRGAKWEGKGKGTFVERFEHWRYYAAGSVKQVLGGIRHLLYRFHFEAEWSCCDMLRQASWCA